MIVRIPMVALVVAVTFAAPPAARAAGPPTSQTIASSAHGRPVIASHYGLDDAPVRLVVIGQMHGNEPAGRRIVSDLSRMVLPPEVQVWLVSTVNPDGAARSRRTNGRGVDINRNFPNRWVRTTARSIYYSGPRAASEPETRGVMAFLSSVRPTAVISFHQSFGKIDDPYPRSHAAARELSRLIRLPTAVVPCPGSCRGTMTGWVNAELQAIAITVEMRRRVNPSKAQHAAAAVLRLGAWLVPAPLPIPQPTSSATPEATLGVAPGALPS